MTPFRLPVSGLGVWFRPIRGAEDIMIAEATRLDVNLALALVEALGSFADGTAPPWRQLPISDVDAALLAVRRAALGDRVSAAVRCTNHEQGCDAAIDITFSIADYLAHHAPTPARGVRHPEDGWFRLSGADVAFRLPTAGDLAAIAGLTDADREIARLCLRPAVVTAPLRRRVEAALDRLAPSLFGEIEGTCPECGVAVRVAFDPQRYVLAELRERSAYVFEETHLLAARYHWSESEILAMPCARRARYADLITAHGSGA
jgi:hypothetical protein